jgi:hypothetical protein
MGEMHTKLQPENMKETGHLGGGGRLGIYGRIILKMALKYDMKIWTALTRLVWRVLIYTT